MSTPNAQLPTPKESQSSSIDFLWELGVGSWKLSRHALFLAALALFLSAHPRAEIIDRILAVVGGDPILQSDALAALRFGLVEVPAGAPDPLRSAIDLLIDRRLQLTEVNRYLPPEPSAAQMETRLAEIRARFPSQAAFDAALAEGGLTVEQLTARVRDTLRIDSYRNQRFAVAFQPTDEELVKYYRAHEADFTVQGQVRPFNDVREDVRERVLSERTDAMIRAWTDGLRRRTEVSVLYGAAARQR
jgi:hypothetical protein